MRMLQLSHISVTVEEKTIVNDFTFSFSGGKIYALLGKNGSGKSSLAFALFHHPRYSIEGEALFLGESLSNLTPNILSERGMFLSFQNVPEIPGIRLIEYLRTIYNHSFEKSHPGEKAPTPFVFRRMVEKLLPEYGIDSKFLDRDLYVGFSGGEKRRIEMLQIALLDPKLILLDEIDSGLDIGALEILSKQIQKWRSMSKVVIIISHNFHLLDTINVDEVVIMSSGQIHRHGEQALIDDIRKNGF
ncbi:MAG: Fe-S cluster assembly ATPase SufC [Candidatus Altimarinota bacterium]